MLMLAPALLVILVLFAGGLILAALQSGGYGRLMEDREVRAAFWFSLWVATASTLLSATAGLLLAVALRELAGSGRIFHSLLQVPLGVPHLAMAVALIHLIAPSGLVARLAGSIGIVELPGDFPQLVNDAYGGGIIAAYVLKETPFIALMTLALLVRTSKDYEAVARTLGASFRQRLWYVTLPLVAPALVSAALVVFAFVFGSFEVAYLLGRPYPAMLAVVAQKRFMAMDLAQRPEAIAIALMMALVTAILIAVYARLAKILIGVERPAVI